MSDYCTEELFLKYIVDHSMEILHDDGNTRHLKFTNSGSSIYGFDLITWPGHLCIAGDNGTYVFADNPDMFEFFRMTNNDFNHFLEKNTGLSIYPIQWSEKLKSISTETGYKEFEKDTFEKTEQFSYHYIWCLYAIVWGIHKYDELLNTTSE